MAERRNPMQAARVEPTVFDYHDYRAYLRGYYEARKQTRAGFSFRTFSKRASPERSVAARYVRGENGPFQDHLKARDP